MKVSLSLNHNHLILSSIGYNLIVAIGGFIDNQELLDDFFVNDVSVIQTGNEDESCNPILYYPRAQGGMTAMFVNDRIVVCGGRVIAEDNSFKSIDECYFFGNDLIWKPFEPLPDVRAYLRSSLFGSDSDTWWLTGGSDGNFQSQQTWLFDGQQFVDGPLLPEEKSQHCQVTVNSTHVFITGGNTYGTFMYNIDLEEWIILEDSPVPLVEGACGLLENPTFGPEILVARSQKSYIFSLTDLTWRDDPEFPLPKVTMNLSYAQLSDGFAAIGGSGTSEVYKFSQDSYSWERLDDELTRPRESAASVAIPGQFLRCT